MRGLRAAAAKSQEAYAVKALVAVDWAKSDGSSYAQLQSSHPELFTASYGDEDE